MSGGASAKKRKKKFSILFEGAEDVGALADVLGGAVGEEGGEAGGLDDVAGGEGGGEGGVGVTLSGDEGFALDGVLMIEDGELHGVDAAFAPLDGGELSDEVGFDGGAGEEGADELGLEGVEAGAVLVREESEVAGAAAVEEAVHGGDAFAGRGDWAL